MKTVLSGIAVVALVATTLPAASQTNPPQVSPQPQSSQGNAPGAGGTSKPETRGMPGNESGTSVKPRESGDEGGVRGTSGDQSGKMVNPPAQRQ